jgi:cbb3-type cytochrome oxidase subunit 3
MTTAEAICGYAVAGGFELLFLAGVAWVWRELARMRVNGPCQIVLGLLVALRLSTAVAWASTGSGWAMDWTWLAEGLFSFAFLYMLYHVGGLIAASRRERR